MSSVLIEDMKKFLTDYLDLEHVENYCFTGDTVTHKIRLKIGDIVIKEVEFDVERK